MFEHPYFNSVAINILLVVQSAPVNPELHVTLKLSSSLPLLKLPTNTAGVVGEFVARGMSIKMSSTGSFSTVSSSST